MAWHPLRSFRRFSYQLAGALQALRHPIASLEALPVLLKEARTSLMETDQNVLFLVVGQALSGWARMEEGLVLVLALLLRTNTQKSGIILYSTINFNAWLSIIDELFVLDPALISFKPRWNKISERIRRIKDLRDSLAHHSFRKPLSESSTSVTLRPSKYDLRQKSVRLNPLNHENISDFSDKVITISEDLIVLIESMADHVEASPGKSAE